MNASDRIILLSIIRKIKEHQRNLNYTHFNKDEFMWMKNNKSEFDKIKRKSYIYSTSHSHRYQDLEKLLCRLELSDRLIR